MRNALITGLVGCLTLASCGGGSGSPLSVAGRNLAMSAEPMPPQVVAPAPTPTPPPTPTADPVPPPAPTPPPPAEAATMTSSLLQLQTDLTTLAAAIKAEVGVPRASTLGACAVTPIGAKACGGPTGYVVYSRVTANEARLLELAERYTTLSRSYNAVTGAVSDCSFAMPPQVELVDGVCTAR